MEDRRPNAYDTLTQEYAGIQHEISTVPYHSTRQVVIDVVDVDEANSLAFGVARAGQRLDWFTYGIGSPLVLGATQRPATNSDTNLTRGMSTNGASDFAIQGLTLSSRGIIVEHADVADVGTPPTNDQVVAALGGEAPVCDPLAALLSPVLGSPVMLEDAISQALTPHVSIEMQTDKRHIWDLGIAQNLPGGGGDSMLRARGEPRDSNRFHIYEGFVWRRDGETESELKIVGRLDTDVVFVLPLSTPPGGTVMAPTRIYALWTMRLFGMEFRKQQ